MDFVIDGELTKVPDDDDLTMAEAEEVARHLDIDIGTSLPTLKLMGLVFIAIRRKNPDGAIVDQVEMVRKMKVADLVKEDATADPLPVNGAGDSETIPDASGALA